MFGGEVGLFGGEASPLPPPLDRTLILFHCGSFSTDIHFVAAQYQKILPSTEMEFSSKVATMNLFQQNVGSKTHTSRNAEEMANSEPHSTTEQTPYHPISGSTGQWSTFVGPAPKEDKQAPKKTGLTAPSISSRLTNNCLAM